MEKCDENIVCLDCKNNCKLAEVGSKICVDGGLVSLQMKEKCADFLVTDVENGGSLGKGWNSLELLRTSLRCQERTSRI